jgi:hypothetical protein
MKKSQS